MAEDIICVNCGNDVGVHHICTDCLELIPCTCETAVTK